LNLDGITCTATGKCTNGRYIYILTRGEYSCEIEMPGLEINEVREDPLVQSTAGRWRLYVDGSSWQWEFAIKIVRRELTEGPPKDI
jgi:hypothetical protein